MPSSDRLALGSVAIPTASSGGVVGVIVPCFNQGGFVNDCIESLKCQSYKQWRAVVLDDASTDGFSSELCHQVANDKIEVRHLRENRGRALVRNEGLSALGDVDFVINVDADDHIAPNYLELLLTELQREPTAGFAFGTLHYFGNRSEGRYWPTRAWRRETMYLENVIPGGGVMFRKEALLQTEGWRAAFGRSGGEDYDIWLQVVEGGWQPLWVREAAYFYRQHSESFLARAGAERILEIELNILAYHKRRISRSIGVGRFMERLILPTLVAAIRRGEWGVAGGLLKRVLAVAPGDVACGLGAYYSRRLLGNWVGNK